MAVATECRNDSNASAQPAALLTWHEVYWQPHRSDLEAAGDAEGLKQLDAWLPALKEHYQTVRKVVIDGKEHVVTTTWLTAVHVLDWLSARRQARWLLTELAPALQMDCSTPAGACARWQALAAWVRRLGHWHQGQQLVGFGEKLEEDDRPGGIPSPYRTWALAFREATAKLLPLIGAPGEIAIHRLLQDIDDVLDGKNIAMTEHIREVDLVARIIATRMDRRGSDDHLDTNRSGRKRKSTSTNTARRPRPEAIDATAKDCLQDAMQAAADAGHAYVPDRKALAGAVSRALDYTINVPSLFGTKNARGMRAARYPGFKSLWDSMQKASRDAKVRKIRRRQV